MKPKRDTKRNAKPNSGTRNKEKLVGYNQDDIVDTILESIKAKNKKK